MALWRQMSELDVDSLLHVADVIHPGLPESRDIFLERLRLFPQGCLVLVKDNKIVGYAISHPIRQRQLPALDTLLGQVSPEADQYYIHDVAILPEFRGHGLAAECVNKLLTIAQNFQSTCLVSVYGTASFWARFGFVPDTPDEMMLEKLRGYGEDATYLSRPSNGR